MTDTIKFVGEVVRVEPDGFGIVRFHNPTDPTGPSKLGMFSNSTSTMVPFHELHPGVKVIGIADIDDHEFAAVRTLTVVPSNR
jgi:hypothetical protein